MIRITLIPMSRFKKALGKDQLVLSLTDQATIDELVRVLETYYGNEISDLMRNKKTGRLTVIGVVNHKRCTPDTILEEGNTVTLLPFLAGG